MIVCPGTLACDTLSQVQGIVTPIPIIIEGLLQVFQRFASSKLVLRAIGSRFVALHDHENGSRVTTRVSYSVMTIESDGGHLGA
jgi:hypothetical protein